MITPKCTECGRFTLWDNYSEKEVAPPDYWHGLDVIETTECNNCKTAPSKGFFGHLLCWHKYFTYRDPDTQIYIGQKCSECGKFLPYTECDPRGQGWKWHVTIAGAILLALVCVGVLLYSLIEVAIYIDAALKTFIQGN